VNGGAFALTYTAVNGAQRLSQLTDAGGAATKLLYNAGGQIAQITDPSGTLYKYLYNTTGQLYQVVNGASGVTTTYTYYPTSKQLKTVATSDGQQTALGYDLVGRLTSIGQSGNVTTSTTISYGLATLSSACNLTTDIGETTVTGGLDNESRTYCYNAAGQVTNAPPKD